MPVFAILTDQENPRVRSAIELQHPGNYYHWTGQVSFVVTPGTAFSVSKALGVKTQGTDGVVSGDIEGVIVLQVSSSYWGWTGKPFWEWLADAQERESK